jgi:hypothetical protein
VRPKILISLSVSTLSAIFITAAPSHAPAIRENNLAATQFKPSVDKFDVRLLNVNLQALRRGSSLNTIFPVLPSSMLALSPSVTNLSVGPEQTGLILLGCALLLLGFFWSKKARTPDSRPTISRMPADPPVRLPELDPLWIEVELTNESVASKTSREAQISA